MTHYPNLKDVERAIDGAVRRTLADMSARRRTSRDRLAAYYEKSDPAAVRDRRTKRRRYGARKGSRK